MIPNKTIEELISRHSTLEKDLSSGTIDKKLFAEKSKEYSDVNEIIENAKKYISFEDDKKELDKILNDSSSDVELRNMAESELGDLKIQHETNEKKLKLDSKINKNRLRRRKKKEKERNAKEEYEVMMKSTI